MTKTDTALEIILALVMVGTAFALGGVLPAAYSLMELTLFLAIFLLLWKQTKAGEIRLSVPAWPLLFAVWVFLQTIPLPSSWIAPSFPMRKLDAGLTGLWREGWSWGTLSIYPHDTGLALLKFLGYLSAFALAAHLFDSRKRRSTLTGTLILLGCFEAVYGLIQYLTGWQKIFTYTKTYFVTEATGTYINRNHFAGVLELTLPFAVAMAFHSFQRAVEGGSNGFQARPQKSGGLEHPAFQALFYLFLVAIMLIGLVFSRSRGGILSIAISLIFIALLGSMKLRRKSWTLGILFIMILVMGYGVWIGLGPVLSRFESSVGPQGLAPEGRITTFQDTMQLIRQHPAFGTGLGTFAIAIRAHQSSSVDKEMEHAHDDYLEVLSETGFPGAVLFFLPVFYLFFKMTASFMDDSRRFRRAVTLGCVGSTLAMLIHTALDFNLQIPANALILAVVLGIGYKAACVEPRSVESRKEWDSRNALRAATH
jgi:O-antigen ligase